MSASETPGRCPDCGRPRATLTNPEGVLAAIALVGLWGAMLGGLVVYVWVVIGV